MTSLVSDFIINPVLRQARRFSRSSVATTDSDAIEENIPAQSTLTPESLLTGALSRAAFEHCPSSSRSSNATESSLNQQRQTPPVTNQSVQQQLLIPTTPEATVSIVSASLSPPLGFSAIDDVERRNDMRGAGATPPRSPTHSRSRSLPEDDGMGPLRRKVSAVQSLDIPSEEKALLMHRLLTERYIHLQTRSAGDSGLSSNCKGGLTSWEQEEALGTFDAFKFWQSTFGDAAIPQKFVLTADDVKRTYSTVVDPDSPRDPNADDAQCPLGCSHYRRNVKLQCSTCSRWYTCRFCHDAVEDHILNRKETKHMLCMLCGCAQKAAEACVNCGELAASYYCNICKLWDTDRPTYHCSGCGICRRGLGLGKDFFHCNTCGICKPMSVAESHKCIERVTDCDCPICGEYMFTSRKRVIYIDACAHSIHEDCYMEHMKTSYKCPICHKSAINMETHFRNLDVEIQQQPMPPEFQDTKAVILCNDCCAKTSVKYHWLGLRCAICRSYNTVELQIIGRLPGAGEINGDTANSRCPILSWADPPLRRRSFAEMRTIGIANNRFELTPGEAPGRIARSVSPTMFLSAENAGEDIYEAEDVEKDVDFWGGDETSSARSDNGDEDKDDSSSEDQDGEDDNDDDEEDEIVLLGHR